MLKKNILKTIAVISAFFLIPLTSGSQVVRSVNSTSAGSGSGATIGYPPYSAVWIMHKGYPDNRFINNYTGYDAFNYAILPGKNSDPYYKYKNVKNWYKEEASQAESVTPAVSTNSDMVHYRNYVRPSERENNFRESPYLHSMSPVITSATGTGVPPFGYNYYTENKIQVPIRDFRAEYWKHKYYRDEFHNQASYSKTYKYNNIFNVSNESDGNSN